jgi:AraC-like DNA-binding protein
VAAADTLAVLARVLSAARRTRRVDRRAEQVILKAKEIIVRSASGPLRVPDLAQELGVGYSWLRQTFRKHTGLAPAQYHAQVRLHQAQEMLEGTDLTIKEISLALEYDTQGYFSRSFRKKTGRWPTEWRRGRRIP